MLENIINKLMEKATREAERQASETPMTSTVSSPKRQVPRELTFSFDPYFKRPKKAPVWQYYKELLDTPAATCNLCEARIMTTNASTTGLLRHLKSRHQNEYLLVLKAQSENFIRKSFKNGGVKISRTLRPVKVAHSSLAVVTNHSAFDGNSAVVVANDINQEFLKLFTNGVMPVSIMDNPVFRAFLTRNAPGMKLYSSKELQELIDARNVTVTQASSDLSHSNLPYSPLPQSR